MTAVSGHITDAKFDPEYENVDWEELPPGRLFDAPVRVNVVDKPVRMNVHR